MERISNTRKYKEERFNKNNNSLILQLLGEKAILFNASLGRLSKSATAGLFLSQLLYWDGKGKNPKKTYKTIADMEMETCLTRSEQDRAIKIWKEINVLEVELRGIPRRRYFHIDKDNLIKLLTKSNNKVPTNQSAESSNTESRIEHAIYTENTTEIIKDEESQKMNKKNNSVSREMLEQCGRAAGKRN